MTSKRAASGINVLNNETLVPITISRRCVKLAFRLPGTDFIRASAFANAAADTSADGPGSVFGQLLRRLKITENTVFMNLGVRYQYRKADYS
jgi:hypothetical protein